MVFAPEIESILNDMPRDNISNLVIYFDDEKFINSLPPATIDTILFGYHNAYVQFMSQVCLDKRDSFRLDEFPDGKVVLSKKRSVFKALYHTPENFDLLPDWVRGYVNFNNSIYVQLHDNYPRLDDERGSTHEFFHTVIPHILGIPAEVLSGLWPTWINEAFTISLSQRRNDSWILEQAKLHPDKLPTLESISKLGIFAHDQRRPEENLAYQYCAYIGETLGKAINLNLGPNSGYQGDLGGICTLTRYAIEHSSNLFSEIESLSINLKILERQARLKLGIGN